MGPTGRREAGCSTKICVAPQNWWQRVRRGHNRWSATELEMTLEPTFSTGLCALGIVALCVYMHMEGAVISGVRQTGPCAPLRREDLLPGSSLVKERTLLRSTGRASLKTTPVMYQQGEILSSQLQP